MLNFCDLPASLFLFHKERHLATTVRLFALFAFSVLAWHPRTGAQETQITPNNQTGIAPYNTYSGDHENTYDCVNSDLGTSSDPSIWVRIPGKSIRVPEGSRSAFLRIPIRWSERSDAGGMILAEVIGMVKKFRVRKP
jgi:hypothetical protein